MSQILQKSLTDIKLISLLILCTVLSRFPIIIYGFGAHSDTWRMAQTASTLFYLDNYVPSRSTGYPLPEFFSAVLVPFGSLGTNLGSLLFTIIAIVLLFLILNIYEIDNQYLLATTFAFLPLVWVHSTATIDYMYALAFALGSWYLLKVNRDSLAGVAFGLAIASRPQFATIGLSILYILYKSGYKRKIIVKVFLISGIITVIAYIPVTQSVGLSQMLGLSGQSSAGNALIQTFNWSFVQWIKNVGFYVAKWVGLTQAVALGIICISGGIISLQERHVTEKEVAAFLWMIPQVAFFLLFPNKGAYLIPALPAVIILLGIYVSKDWLLTGICIILILNNFVTPSLAVVVNEPQGAVERNLQNRQMKVAASEAIVETVMSENPTGSISIVGGGIQSSIKYKLRQRCQMNYSTICDRIKVVGYPPQPGNTSETIYYTPQAQYQTPYDLSQRGKIVTYSGNFTYQYTPYKNPF